MKNKTFKLIIILCMLVFVSGCGKKIESTTEATTEQLTTEYIPVATKTDVEEPVKDEDGFYVTDDYVKTVGETVNVRVKPDTTSDIYMLLEDGTVLNRTGYNNEWARVIVTGEPFYVYGDFVVETEAPQQEETEEEEDTEGEEEEDAENRIYKVVIDAGKQATLNVSLEQLGPDSEETKQAVTTGIIGATYGTRESELNLKLAGMLRDELVNRGYEVIMTRESDEVDITNKARAELANEAEADAYIRLQMGESANSELSGAMSMCMTSDSPYNSNLHDKSYTLATRLLQGVVDNTGTDNRGVYETDEMIAINWSKVPVAVVNLAFLSNEADESNIIDSEYQKKVIKGLANGVDYYFEN